MVIMISLSIKESDHYTRFAFFTGVSKFSKVCVFSGLNNLRHITFQKYFQLYLEIPK